MNCRESKIAIALHLGQDNADPSDWEQARRHAATCDECRQLYKSMKKSMALLEQSDVEKTYDLQESLWPEIETRLTQQTQLSPDHKLRNWGGFVTLTVACLLFVMVWVNPPREPDPYRSHGQTGRGVGVPFSEVFHSSQTESVRVVPVKDQPVQDESAKDLPAPAP